MENAYNLEIPLGLDEVCKPARTALLVYDMQVGIIKQLANGQQVTARVKAVLDAARAAGLRVFFMRHMSLPKEAAGVSQLRMAMAWQKVKTVAEVHPWFGRDSPGFQLVPELQPLDSEVIFDKITDVGVCRNPVGYRASGLRRQFVRYCRCSDRDRYRANGTSWR